MRGGRREGGMIGGENDFWQWSLGVTYFSGVEGENVKQHVL